MMIVDQNTKKNKKVILKKIKITKKLLLISNMRQTYQKYRAN